MRTFIITSSFLRSQLYLFFNFFQFMGTCKSTFSMVDFILVRELLQKSSLFTTPVSHDYKKVIDIHNAISIYITLRIICSPNTYDDEQVMNINNPASINIPETICWAMRNCGDMCQ